MEAEKISTPEDEKGPGRPLSYETAELLQQAVDKYFEDNKRATLAGLALALGIDRQTLYNYEKRQEYFDIIKKARSKVEAIYEERLVWDNCTGVIFPLKNMGWKDKTEVETRYPDGVQIHFNKAGKDYEPNEG